MDEIAHSSPSSHTVLASENGVCVCVGRIFISFSYLSLLFLRSHVHSSMMERDTGRRDD